MSGSALAVLKRMPPTEGATIARFWGNLPEQADGVLGYDILRKRKRSLDLRATLDEMGASPFTPESVEKYKQEVTKTTIPRLLFFHRAAPVIFGIGVFGLFLCFGPAILGWLVSWKIGLAFMGGLVASCAITFPLEGFVTKGPGSWNVTPLNGYAEPVPEFVLRQALEIKERFPEAEFFVHEFVQKEKVLDPFLVVSRGDEQHFIAVWEEPAFRAEPNQRGSVPPDLARVFGQLSKARRPARR